MPGKVIYKTEHNAVGRFPEPGDGSFIERRQTEVIEKILRHCGLWEEGSARGPPAAQAKAVG